jgi:hypothetical protein
MCANSAYNAKKLFKAEHVPAVDQLSTRKDLKGAFFKSVPKGALCVGVAAGLASLSTMDDPVRKAVIMDMYPWAFRNR